MHAREDQKIDLETKFHESRSSNGWEPGAKLKRGLFLTLDHMGTPLENQNVENRVFFILEKQKIGLGFHEPKGA